MPASDKGTIDKGNGPGHRPPVPFVGARPFDTGDGDRFFGMEKETDELCRLWRRDRLIVLHGAAGVGKTSLLHAGAIPRLTSERAHVLPVGDVAHRPPFPMAALPEQNPYAFGLLSSWFPGESPTMLSGASVAGGVRRHTTLDRFGQPSPVFAAIDQAESLFRPARNREDQRGQLLRQLREALQRECSLHLLIVVREDLLDEVLSFAGGLDGGEPQLFRLEPLDQASALDAVEQTTGGRTAGFDHGTAQHLVGELRTIRTAKGLPTERATRVHPTFLQLVCERLWKELAGEPAPGAEQMAIEIDHTLREYCEEVLSVTAADHSLSPRELAQWFHEAFSGHRTVAADEDEAPAVESTSAEDRVPLSVLHALEDGHLISACRRAGHRWYALNPRLTRPIEQLSETPGPVRRSDPRARLAAAQRALSEGDHSLARYHVQAAIRASHTDDLRLHADAEVFLGNVAYELSDLEQAAACYRKAAELYEAEQDTVAVGHLLAAIGRLKLLAALDAPRTRETGTAKALGEIRVAEGVQAFEREAKAAVTELSAAANRIPNDPVVQTLLGQALWYAGQPKAALAALDHAVHRGGGSADTLRVRGEYLADLGVNQQALRDLDRIDWKTRPATRAARQLALTSDGTPNGTPNGATNGTAAVLLEESRGPGGEPLGGEDRLYLEEILAGSDNGPMLLRAARLHERAGDIPKAAALARRSLKATHPPLPPHLRAIAWELRIQ